MCLPCSAGKHDECEARNGAVTPCICSCVNPDGMTFIQLCEIRRKDTRHADSS